MSLVSSLGIGSRLIHASDAARRRYLCMKGRLVPVPMSPPAFLSTRLLGPSAKLRALMELALPRGPGGEESIAAFVSRRFGAGVARTVVDAMVAGIFAGDAERLSIRSAFPKIWDLERTDRSVILGAIKQMRRDGKARGSGKIFSFDDGVQVLTDAMAGKLADLKLKTTVETISRDGDGLKIAIADESGRREIQASAAVIALPAYAAAGVLKTIAPGVAGILSTILYAPVAVVHLGYRTEDAGRSGDGFGFLVPRSEPVRILGCIFATTIFPGRAPSGRSLLTAFVGGAREPTLVSLPDDELVSLVSGELTRILGAGRPVFHRVVKHERAIPQYEIGHGARLAALDAVLAGVPGVSLAGNAYRGIGVADCVREAPIVARSVAGRSEPRP
jgi:oxygen-dependent protoporphyrinogen oxidase